jgi:hypothetical protein
MTKTHFKVLVALLSVMIVMLVWNILPGITKQDKGDDASAPQVVSPQPDPPITPPDDNCSVCGRDRVTAHGGILLKNTTQRTVQIRVRHHPGVSELVVQLDPNGLEMIDDILVGTMMLRFLGEGFDEETFCTVLANTKHEMWWTVHGSEMHGTSAMHMGH